MSVRENTPRTVRLGGGPSDPLLQKQTCLLYNCFPLNPPSSHPDPLSYTRCSLGPDVNSSAIELTATEPCGTDLDANCTHTKNTHAHFNPLLSALLHSSGYFTQHPPLVRLSPGCITRGVRPCRRLTVCHRDCDMHDQCLAPRGPVSMA